MSALSGLLPEVVERSYLDLRADALETRPAPWPPDSAGGRQLLELVEQDPDPAGKPAEFEQGDLTKKNAELLRELGYLE